MLGSREDTNSSDGSVAHSSDISGDSGCEQVTFPMTLPDPEFSDGLIPTSQWHHLNQQLPCTSDLVVSEVGEGSEDDDSNSNDGHSLTGRGL